MVTLTNFLSGKPAEGGRKAGREGERNNTCTGAAGECQCFLESSASLGLLCFLSGDPIDGPVIRVPSWN